MYGKLYFKPTLARILSYASWSNMVCFPIEGDGHPPINGIYYSASVGLDSQYGIDDHKSFTKWHIWAVFQTTGGRW